MSDWLYDEYKQTGIDYSDKKNVTDYDNQMAKLRNVDHDVQDLIDVLKIESGHIIADLGCGTADYTIALAQRCQHVYGTDVSHTMLDYAQQKAVNAKIDNVTLVHAGLLDYSHEGPELDCVVSQFVLHHLPDFWKMFALRNIHSMLGEGGLLYLKDVVFPAQMEKLPKTIDYTINAMRSLAGDAIADEYVVHIKDEYSTYDWIMEEMLYRSGFDILKADYGDGLVTVYICRKVSLEK